MSAHPVATEEQHEHELHGLEIARHPTVRAAYDRIQKDWLENGKPAPGEDMRACCDRAFQEVMFSAALWGSNRDPLRPKTICVTRLGHPVGGTVVPGTRWGVDNPDSVYRVIPISGDERYRITGRVPEHRLPENYFTLWDRDWNTVDVFDGSKLVLQSDRTFEIFVDSDPAGDRPNHIRSSPKAQEFYIRDVLQDWSVDTPNDLAIELLGGPPGGAALSLDEEADRVAATMLEFASNSRRYNQQAYDKPVNELAFTIDRDTDGALRNQIYIMGHFDLDDDQALVIDVHLGGASYFIAPITNYWGTSNGIVDRTGCLNLAQSAPNADGTLTFVVSKHDPGVPNWLDPSDMREGVLTLRWAEFEDDRPGADLGATSRVVPLARLREHLPAETPSFDADARALQQAERAAGYLRRLPEGLA